MQESSDGEAEGTYVDRREAARRFGVSEDTWQNWVTLGRVPAGRLRGRKKVYTASELDAVMRRLRPADIAFPDPDRRGYYKVPATHVRREDACRMFGVDYDTWRRWEQQGKITCGHRVNAGAPMIYPIAELERLLEACGRFAPPYPDPERPGCYRVPLTGRDIHRREAIVDAASMPVIEGRKWCWSEAVNGDGGHVILSDATQITPLRRLILGITDPEVRVSHVNGDSLDCRRENLIVRTVAEMIQSFGKLEQVNGRPPTSRFKGVSWDKSRGKWAMQIKVKGQQRFKRRFYDEIAAAQAYDDAARELFGDHAWLNFPDGVDARLEAEAREAEAREQEAAGVDDIEADPLQQAA